MLSVNATRLPIASAFAAILSLSLLGACAAQRVNDDAPPIAFAAVALPDYDSDRGIRTASSQEDYDGARADDRYVMERFSYPSGDLVASAYIYRPARTEGRLPVIVYNRGGFIRGDFAGDTLVQAHRFAEAGYMVVSPFYRGSNGTDGRDEMGGADVADLMNLAPQIARLPGADARRVYLVGESRGGMMVYQALRDGFPARAAAVYGAFTDLAELIGPDGPQREFAPRIWPDIELNREAIIERRSALRWPERINTPVLIMHGSEDTDIPVSHSTRMAQALTEAGRRHELRIFDGARHTISTQGDARDRAIVAWFHQFD